MLILEIVAALALLFAVLGMMLGFGSTAKTKFGFKALAPATICLWQLYAVLFYAGRAWMAMGGSSAWRHAERHACCRGCPLRRIVDCNK